MPTSQRAKDIMERDLNDLKARILQDDKMLKAMPGNVEPEVINNVSRPLVIGELISNEINPNDRRQIRLIVPIFG